MPIKPLAIYTQFYNSNTFSLSVKHDGIQTKLVMKMNNNLVNTRDLPETYTTIKRALPSVLHSTCYNDDNTPFFQEILRTEIGHLFEHILIEYMCLIKMDNGAQSAEYSGITKWNWVVYPVGSFHITVSSGNEDLFLFSEAIKKTISLTEELLHTSIVNNTVIPISSLADEFIPRQFSSLELQ
jgi:hypothetical protein